MSQSPEAFRSPFPSSEEFSESSTSEFQQTIVLHDHNPRVINMLTTRWQDVVIESHFDANGNQVALDAAEVTQKELHQNGAVVALIRQNKIHEVSPRITLFASSPTHLAAMIESLKGLLDAYDLELQHQVEAAAATEDQRRQDRWISKLLSHPSNHLRKRQFFYNPGLTPQ